MAYSVINGTRVFKRTEYEVEYIEMSALFGLIRWTEILKQDALGTDVIIESEMPIKNIILNGKKIANPLNKG